MTARASVAAAMANIADVAGATRDSIGRYFSLVSFIPSALLVAYAFSLFSSGVLNGPPRPENVVRAAAQLNVSDAGVLILLSVGLGLILHPLQFAMVQFLEGYWGTGRIAQRIRRVRITRHWERLLALRLRTGYYQRQLDLLPENGSPGERIALVSRRDEAERLSANQPDEPELIMPTRLGNVLRYYEVMAGAAYQLDAIKVMPYIARVASAEDMDYVNDQRSNLDLAVRLSLVSVLAFVLSVALLWRYGLWLLVALAPYALAVLSYRGAVVAADAYGQAFATIIALNRFTLYERLHLPMPKSMPEERVRNVTLGRILDYSEFESVVYEHPQP